MDTPAFSRRRALQLGGGAGLVALAGCIGPFASDDDDADYAQYIGPGEDDESFFVYFNLDEDDEVDDDDGGEVDSDDPMLAPILLGAWSLLGAAFALESTSLNPLIGFGEETDTDSDTDIRSLLLVSETVVLVGDIDRDEVSELLGESTEAQGRPAPIQYNQETEDRGYDIYEGEYAVDGDLPDDLALDADPVAVGDDEIIVGPSERFEQVVDAIEDVSRTTTDDEDFDWLVSTAGGGDIVFGEYIPSGLEGDVVPDDDEIDDPVDEAIDAIEATLLGIVNGVEVDDNTFEATLALVFDEALNEDEEDSLEEVFGFDGEDLTFEFDDSRVSVTATYSDEDV